MTAATVEDRFLGFKVMPLNRRRLRNFRANQRGFWSLWIFMVIWAMVTMGLLLAA